MSSAPTWLATCNQMNKRELSVCPLLSVLLVYLYHPHRHTPMYTYTHTHMHACMHTHTHTHPVQHIECPPSLLCCSGHTVSYPTGCSMDSISIWTLQHPTAYNHHRTLCLSKLLGKKQKERLFHPFDFKKHFGIFREMNHNLTNSSHVCYQFIRKNCS